MPTRKLTTKAACDVAGINRDRFNEFVAAGTYDCAPPTVAGRARGFDEIDIITLIMFRHFMEDGVTATRAGRLACLIGGMLREQPDLDEVVVVETYVGSPVAFSPETAPNGSDYVSGSTIRRRTFHNVAQPRRITRHAIDEHFSLAGEDD